MGVLLFLSSQPLPLSSLAPPRRSRCPLSHHPRATASTDSHPLPSQSPAKIAEPLLIRVARKQPVDRPPVWLMRQAGRYMAAFRNYSDVHPFRHRSESPHIATELSLQPYRAFGTDAIIMFSDILTPLPALGINFDVISGSGPRIDKPIRDVERMAMQLETVFDPQGELPFISDILGDLRAHLASDPETALLGFVAAPFTLASYIIEGHAVKNLLHVKQFMYGDEGGHGATSLHALLDYLAEALARYAIYQIDCGAQAVQLFDSWAHHLSPEQYAQFALPYAAKAASIIKEQRPDSPIIFFANGSAGKLYDIGRQMCPVADVIGLDWSVRMSDARRIFGDDVVLQGNVDPTVLAVGTEKQIRQEVRNTFEQGGRNLIINLGHGVIKQTPESAVATFVDEVKSLSYD